MKIEMFTNAEFNSDWFIRHHNQLYAYTRLAVLFCAWLVGGNYNGFFTSCFKMPILIDL